MKKLLSIFLIKFNEFVAKNDIVLAGRIVAPVDESNKQIQNTYVPIGAKNLPKELKQQTDNELIENSSYNTVYVVVSGSMNAEQVAEGLLQLNATVRVLPTNYETALFRLLLNTPQSVLIVIGILITYISFNTSSTSFWHERGWNIKSFWQRKACDCYRTNKKR